MAEHVLKTWPNAFDAIADGRKRFEWRRDDRGYEVGDTLVLRKWDPHGLMGGAYVWTPYVDGKRDIETIRARVTYILRGMFGVPDGFCVMSITPAPDGEKA